MKNSTVAVIGAAIGTAGAHALELPFPAIGDNPYLDLIADNDPGIHAAIRIWYYAAPGVAVSRQVGWRFHVALVLAHETGHRIGAIRKLTWPDIDFEGKTVRWRAEHEKTGYEHITPLTAEALDALEDARRMGRGKKNGPVLPSSRDATRCTNRVSAFLWWKKAQTLAGLEPKRDRGWHSLRRKFATDLMDLPLKVLCELGGWKSPQTVLRCYQQADAGQLRTALESRPRDRT